MNKFITKVAKLVLGLSLAAGVGVAIGTKTADADKVDAAAGDVITNHANIVSGKYYYIRAVVSSNDPDYFVATGGTAAGNGLSRNNISTTQDGATKILFTGSGTSWTMQFENGNYLYLRSNESNGYYSVSTTAQTWTASTSNNLITFTINSKKLLRNSTYNTKYFGSYSSSGTAVTLVECPAASNHTVSYNAGTGASGTISSDSGTSITLKTWSDISEAVTPPTGKYFAGWNTAANGSGTAYAPGQTVSSDLTLYAQWVTPISVADARNAIDAGSGTTGVYVLGLVDSIPNPYDSGYGNISFNMVDSLNDSDFLEAFRCTGSYAPEVEIGDTVVVKGNLTKYNTTYEFSAGCEIVYLEHASGTTYQVSFNVNGGDGNPESMNVVDGLPFVFPSAGAKASNIFRGWSSDSGSTFYQVGETSPVVTANISYTAYWQTKGTSSDPYTVAEAKLAIDNNDGVVDACVSGKISQVDSYNSTYHSITYWISSDGTTSGQQIEVYSGKGLASANFSSINDVLVEASVVVCGDLKLHEGDYEFAQNNYLVSYTAPAVTYTVTYTSGGADSGSVPTDLNSPYDAGDTVTVLGNTGNLVKEGYTFAGWNDGTTTYQAGSSFTITANTTLTAQWNAVETPNTPPYEADFTTVSNHSYSQNHEFTLGNKSWVSSVSQVASSVFYLGTNSNNASYGVLNNNSTFSDVSSALAASDEEYDSYISTCHAYALLFEHQYNGVKSLTFDWVGGNNAFQIYLFGDTGSGFAMLAHVDYAEASATTPGSISWTNSSSTSNFVRVAIVARPGTTSTHATSKTLRAGSFEISAAAAAETYTISYNANGGEGSMSNTTGENPSVAACSFTYEGYTFVRWNTQSNGEGDDYAVGTTVTANLTLYAIWQINGALPTSDSAYFFKLDSIDEITTGKYVIAVNTGSYYGMDRTTLSSGKYSFGSSALSLTNGRIGPDNIGNFVYEIEKTQSGTITIVNPSTDKYVKYSSSTNLGEDTTSYEWTVSTGVKGTFRLTSGTAGRVLAARANGNDKFGGYSSNNITAGGTEYYDIELFRAFTATDFAEHILTKITCNAQGTSAPSFASGYSWSDLNTEYTTKLASAQQELLENADANESGNTLEQAMAKYDYIVGKYGTSTYTNFIGRSITPFGGAKVMLAGVINENTNTVAIIVVISMVSVTAIGGYFFLKKRREQN